MPRRFLSALFLLPLLLPSQMNLLSVAPPPKLVAKRGTKVEAKLNAQLQNGSHVNSNKPADEYLIPLRLTWTETGVEISGEDKAPGFGSRLIDMSINRQLGGDYSTRWIDAALIIEITIPLENLSRRF